METDNQRRYRLNINGFRDKKIYRGYIKDRIESERTKLLISLPTEELLSEVGYYERKNNL